MEDIEDIREKDRIAIVDPNKCKPEKCGKECIKMCPVVRQGKVCIDIGTINLANTPKKVAQIHEQLCIGCGICVKSCPFNAIKIVNVPKGLKRDIVHRYGPNSFKLHKLPDIKSGQVTGILGQNGLGKSTIMNIFNGSIKMNIGQFNANVDKVVTKMFRGTNIQKIVEGKITTTLKPQNLNNLRQDIIVRDYLGDIEATNASSDIVKLLDRSMQDISGGELQRVVITKICNEESELYMFDEPTSFLDLKQRVEMANMIRGLVNNNSKKYVMVVDHDVNILDYVSDQLVILYGERAVYGVCATPLPVSQGVNSYFEGYLQKDNVRFRKQPFTFEATTNGGLETNETVETMFGDYPQIDHIIGDFSLMIKAGTLYRQSITVLLGENGTGKTTFVNVIADHMTRSGLAVSIKDQNIDQAIKEDGKRTVKEFLGNGILYSPFLEIGKNLQIDSLLKNKLYRLSGGELQKVAIMKCLMTPANVYLFDEPSAFLDTETRIVVSKVIKDYFFEKPVSVFVIDHDMLMTTFLADRAIIFEGVPGSNTVASSPVPINEGMNQYLKSLGITMRVDRLSRRRLNKLGSAKDQEQKKANMYY